MSFLMLTNVNLIIQLHQVAIYQIIKIIKFYYQLVITSLINF